MIRSRFSLVTLAIAAAVLILTVVQAARTSTLDPIWATGWRPAALVGAAHRPRRPRLIQTDGSPDHCRSVRTNDGEPDGRGDQSPTEPSLW